jgi:hypothetical protein
MSLPLEHLLRFLSGLMAYRRLPLTLFPDLNPLEPSARTMERAWKVMLRNFQRLSTPLLMWCYVYMVFSRQSHESLTLMKEKTRAFACCSDHQLIGLLAGRSYKTCSNRTAWFYMKKKISRWLPCLHNRNIRAGPFEKYGAQVDAFTPIASLLTRECCIHEG